MNAVGSSPRRGGGYGRVTGHQEYLADIKLPDALHVKLVTLECARARINAIDSTEAEQVPGVHFVMTAADLPDPMPRFGPQFQDRPVIAVGETKYHGEPVAAVAAETKDAAEEAALLVKVDYTKLEDGIFSVADALAPDAVLVQDPALRGASSFAQTNIIDEKHFGWGDIDDQEAHLVVEDSFQFPMVTHFAIEPHGFMAAPDGDGIEVWSTIQHPYLLQKIMAKMLDLPLSKVRVHAPDPGGGFGGKQIPKFEPLVAFMALRAGRPVRLVLSLDETFQQVRRSSAEIRVRAGFTAEGVFTFMDIETNFLVGAYVDIADRVVSKSSYSGAGPYRIPAVKIIGRTILSHTTPSTAFRGFGIPQIGWARESLIDEAALQLGIDRLQIRLLNLARYKEPFIPSEEADGDWEQTVRTAAKRIGWGDPLPPNRGRGIAVGLKSGPTTGLSYSTVRLLYDGSAMVYAGTSDMGQGARTIFAQITAEELGVPLDDITVVMGDTSVVPYDQQTSASRSSVLMGTAVQRACFEIQGKVRAMAAKLYNVDEGDIKVDQGRLLLPDREFSVVDVMQEALAPLGGEVIGNGEMRKDKEPDHPLGGTAAFFEFNCTASEVEVDMETGHVTLVKHVTVGDVGKALNPLQVTMQDDGAAIMGLGHTLMEHYIFDNEGRVRNIGAIDYRILTSMDLPLDLHSESVENADGPGPYGIKGVSEGSLLVTAPAVGAAVREATGKIIRDLPLTPQRVWEALQEDENGS
ncbi:MAG: xanthine dehydrogenase family protein molybdopterin-binding subunit [Acidimicrobiia bacterium]|nr:xanthine dehydrogenase family protein molybdopterin-binding subunit [Acidimicrobiia bacterium]